MRREVADARRATGEVVRCCRGCAYSSRKSVGVKVHRYAHLNDGAGLLAHLRQAHHLAVAGHDLPGGQPAEAQL